ncbi:uncharacterized protein LOC121970929 [Zingiber officinale]|uniref:Uncharacterized protein n=1 Tax=Zingiber officinale TaxID=94328 RepID=A0A8J5LNY9_ZINOF|nr:uncharacterized protein LOC121970929 [Zingiber officinale]XP_042377897.1 uncharacterized protein LOC121970929 [Zingiber officinale]XP_042377905.1 uncharacterized protein LOC121970929 [Zingiber officinale]KAG6532690.1 hypothetical protein ZIOFF_006540 [Zingiber officinale]
MGCSHSCQLATPPPGCVRVIHATGHVVDLPAPVTAGELTGRPPAHVLVSAARLATFGSERLLPGERLAVGGVYFLLPHALLRDESSIVDLATHMGRLLAAAAKRAVPVVDPRKVQPRARVWKPVLDQIEETNP